MKKLLSNFADTTTGHGWGNIQQRKSKCTKVAWLILCIASTIASISQVTSIIYRYCLFDTKDRVVVETRDLVFPSVTVCPLTQLSKQGLLKYTEDLENNDFKVAHTLAALQTLMLQIDSIGKNSTMLETKEYERHQKFYNNFFKEIFTYQGIYENIPSVTKYGHEKDDFISSCIYQGESCSEEDVTTMIHYYYFNCFTFNGVNTTLSHPNSNVSGPVGGLSLQFFLDTDEDIYNIYNPDYPTSGTEGVKVVIHEKGTLPDLENDGFEVEVGRSVNVALSVNQRELMKPPWGECADPPWLDEGGYIYSKKACKMRCLQKMVVTSCGCKRGSLPMYPDVENFDFCYNLQIDEWLKSSPNKTLLQYDLEKLGCSVEEHAWDVVLGQADCQCQEKCNYYTYDMTISQSQWPKRGVELDFYCSRIALLPNYVNSSVYKAYHHQMGTFCLNLYHANLPGWNDVKQTIGDSFRENFLRLNVYFKDLETKITKEEADFTFGSMISEIGGSLGIFIGVSIITIAEVFILCVSIIQLLTKKSVQVGQQDLSQGNEKYNKQAWP